MLLCLFAGPLAEVRAVSERAGLPFERILGCLGSAGPNPNERKDNANERKSDWTWPAWPEP